MTLRRIALGAAVAALVAVAALALVAPALEREPSLAAHHETQVDALRGAARAVPGSWVRVRVGAVSYAAPPAWSLQPAAERVAYREDGAVLASGRGQAVWSVDGCPVAWAVLADPVRSTNV